MTQEMTSMSDNISRVTRLQAIIREINESGYGDGRNGAGHPYDISEWEQQIKDLFLQLATDEPESEKPEYIAGYSYDYVQDGNLDDLCEYVFDKGVDYANFSIRKRIQEDV
jgi:hypothetical protein